jgi:hypothetical protein
MGIFLRTFAAVCAADAIDRAASNRPTRYWYPNRPGLPRPGTSISYIALDPPRAPPAPAPRPAVDRGTARWDWLHPERPS